MELLRWYSYAIIYHLEKDLLHLFKTIGISLSQFGKKHCVILPKKVHLINCKKSFMKPYEVLGFLSWRKK